MNNHPDPNVWWQHRRRKSYIAIFAAIIQTFLLGVLAYFKPETITVLGSVIAWSYGFYSLIVTNYYANTAVEEYMKRKS